MVGKWVPRWGGASLVVLALVGGALTLTGPANAATKLKIWPAVAFGAPKGGKGGIDAPVVSSSNGRGDAKVRVHVRIVNTKTGQRIAKSWTGGGLPGMWFPRVEPGTYRVTTTGSLRGATTIREQVVTVHRKTAKSTISRSEFNRLRKGMTRTQVARIVGNGGHSPWTYRGEKTWLFDMMPFWRYADVTFRNGHLSAKDWNIPHD